MHDNSVFAPYYLYNETVSEVNYYRMVDTNARSNAQWLPHN